MGDILKLLTQVAGVGALLLVIIAGAYFYRALRARKESRSAMFGAERQSAGDRAIRAALGSMIWFGLALLLLGIALVGENITPPPVAQRPTPTSTRAATDAKTTPTVVTPIVQPTQSVGTVAAPPTPTPTISSVQVVTGTTQPRKTAVVSGVGENLLKLRREPATSADIIAQYPDGTVLEVLEGQQTNQGIVWQQVRDAQGNEGWVANQYLVYNP